MAVATIFYESSLQGWLNPRYFREVNISFYLLLCRCFVVKFLKPVAIYHDDPGFFRVGRID